MGTQESKQFIKWWSQTGSNRRPLACHASALPAELWPHARRGKLRFGLRYVKQTKAIASQRRRLTAPDQLSYSRAASIPVSATGDTLKYVPRHDLLARIAKAYPS